jgi:hypothetical protein
VHTVFALYSSSYSFSPPSPRPTGTNLPPGRSVSAPLFSNFWKERENKWHFHLFKMATQRVSLWHFHVYMYCNLNWFISSIFLLSILVPFLQWFQ